MTKDDRDKLEALYVARVPVTEIARQLGFCRQTIYNEIHRGLYTHTCDYWDELRYSADKGQDIHDRNQAGRERPLKIGHDHAYARFLEDKMLGVQEDGTVDTRKRCSPAVALELARREGYTTNVCVTTLYSYIEKRVFLHLTNKDLWEKGRKEKRGYHHVRRIAHPVLPSITDRPEAATRRMEKGHQEMDLIVGREGTKAAVLTLTDRKGRMEQSYKIPDKRASSVRAVFDKLEREMGKEQFRETFKSITTDNGPEFLEYEKLTKSIFGGKRFEVYYCHSYSAWEKGTNENHNRFLQRFFPKGTDFTKVSQAEITDAQEFMNHYPRRSLGWLTPLEAAGGGAPLRPSRRAGPPPITS